jgi:hypothetical protein
MCQIHPHLFLYQDYLLNRLDRYPFQPILHYCGLAIAGFAIALITIIPIRLAFVVQAVPEPQAILALGSDLQERHINQLRQQFPGLEVWSSAGIDPQMLFELSQIPSNQFHANYAEDVVIGLTELINTFHAQQIQHLCLLASEAEMPRVSAIAFLILGSEDIVYTPFKYIPLALSERSPSPWQTIQQWLWDLGRSLWWMATK